MQIVTFIITHWWALLIAASIITSTTFTTRSLLQDYMRYRNIQKHGWPPAWVDDGED